jgi:putative restriction endonuclease
MFDAARDARTRSAAFSWLENQVAIHGDVLPRAALAKGFTLDGVRVPLLGPQGIFKPQILSEAPLSITTAPKGPYDDSFGPDNLLRYRYRGTNPEHVDNRGLRFAMKQRLPLVYLHGVVPGKYLATWPVFVVRDDPSQLVFTVAVDEASSLSAEGIAAHANAAEDAARRVYVTASVRVRLHQRAFRERVLDAYRRQCAFCRLKHVELLDAAHIVPDSEPLGEPSIANGLALCNLHHAAFDRYFIGLRPDYTIEIRADILRERDGPTLRHAIQALHETKIVLPSKENLRPAQQLLELRYERFRQFRP